jgi:hypothetical protein
LITDQEAEIRRKKETPLFIRTLKNSAQQHLKKDALYVGNSDFFHLYGLYQFYPLTKKNPDKENPFYYKHPYVNIYSVPHRGITIIRCKPRGLLGDITDSKFLEEVKLVVGRFNIDKVKVF